MPNATVKAAAPRYLGFPHAETIIDDLSMPRPSLLGAWPHSHPEAPPNLEMADESPTDTQRATSRRTVMS